MPLATIQSTVGEVTPCLFSRIVATAEWSDDQEVTYEATGWVIDGCRVTRSLVEENPG